MLEHWKSTTNITLDDETSETLKFKMKYAHSSLHLLFTLEHLANTMSLVIKLKKINETH